MDGVAAYIADEDADVYNVIDAAVREDALAAALNLTALAADAVAALAAVTRREPSEVLRSLRQGSPEQPPPMPDPADRRAGSVPETQIDYPHAMDAYDWAIAETKGWIEVTVRWEHGQRVITFYDPTRLAQEVAGAISRAGYFADGVQVVVPTLTRDAIEAAVAAIARRGFMDIS
jgi:hypothetical protein